MSTFHEDTYLPVIYVPKVGSHIQKLQQLRYLAQEKKSADELETVARDTVCMGTSYTRHLTTCLESNTPSTDPRSYRTALFVEALLLRNTSYEVIMITRSQLYPEKELLRIELQAG